MEWVRGRGECKESERRTTDRSVEIGRMATIAMVLLPSWRALFDVKKEGGKGGNVWAFNRNLELWKQVCGRAMYDVYSASTQEVRLRCCTGNDWNWVASRAETKSKPQCGGGGSPGETHTHTDTDRDYCKTQQES